ncbi:MAG: hypothetical protein V4634_11540 [Pseudomonadota bacterium]
MIEHYIECNECSFTGEYNPDPYRFKRWVYDLGVGSVAPVIERISWCYDCANFVRAEKLVSQDDISAMLADYAQTVKTGGRALQDNLEFAEEVLNSEAHWRAFAAEREKSKCRCITCGSTNIEAEAEFDYFSSGKIDSFRHPGCGGKLRVVRVESDMHISWRRAGMYEREPRAIFSKDGLIKIVEELPGPVSSLEAFVPENADEFVDGNSKKFKSALLKNPFYQLGVSVLDNGLKIYEQAAIHTGPYGQHELQEACRILTEPDRRLAAELAWISGLSPEATARLIKYFHGDSGWGGKYCLIRFGNNLRALSETNCLAIVLEVCDDYAGLAGEAIVVLASAICSLDADKIMIDLNKSRQKAGFPSIESIDEVEKGLEIQKRYYTAIVDNLLEQVFAGQIDEVMSSMVARCGSDRYPFIDAVLEKYERKTNVSLQAGAEQISQLVKKLTENKAYSLEANDALLDELNKAVLAWNLTAKPLRENLAEYELQHELSREVYLGGFRILLLLISGKRYEQSSRLLESMQKSFEDVPEHVGKLAEVKQVIQKNRAEHENLQRERKTATPQDSKKIPEPAGIAANTRNQALVTEISTGLFLGEKFRLYSTEIEWKNQRMALDDISWIIWGGIPTFDNRGHIIKRDAVIRVGNSERSLDIQGFSESKATAVINALREPLCNRLMSEIMAEIKSGKILAFGNAKVTDNGVYLSKREQFQISPAYCAWDDIIVEHEHGDLVISSNSDQHTYVKISYLNVENAHMLEMIVTYVLKKGMQKISDLLPPG